MTLPQAYGGWFSLIWLGLAWLGLGLVLKLDSTRQETDSVRVCSLASGDIYDFLEIV